MQEIEEIIVKGLLTSIINKLKLKKGCSSLVSESITDFQNLLDQDLKILSEEEFEIWDRKLDKAMERTTKILEL